MRVALSQGLCWRLGSDRQLLLLVRSWSQQCGIDSVVASLGMCIWTMVSPSLGWVWGIRLTAAEEMQLLKMSLCPRCRKFGRKGQQISNRVGGGVWFAVGRQNTGNPTSHMWVMEVVKEISKE